MKDWFSLHPKFVAAAVTAGVIYLLHHSGVDISPLWQQLSPLMAAYLMPAGEGA